MIKYVNTLLYTVLENFNNNNHQFFIQTQVENATANGQTCDNASSYCGTLNARYPDARAMGYPFDRTPRDGVVTLQQFVTSNMLVKDMNIRFENRTVSRSQPTTGKNRPTTGNQQNSKQPSGKPQGGSTGGWN